LYIGHHDDYGAALANLILPTTTIFESKLYFRDIFGKIKICSKIDKNQPFVKYRFSFIRIFGNFVKLSIDEILRFKTFKILQSFNYNKVKYFNSCFVNSVL